MTFEEARAHLVAETQRQWSGRAIARTAPVLLGLPSLVTLLAMRWHGEGVSVAERAAWYAEGGPTFSDGLALARQRIRRYRNRMGWDRMRRRSPCNCRRRSWMP